MSDKPITPNPKTLRLTELEAKWRAAAVAYQEASRLASERLERNYLAEATEETYTECADELAAAVLGMRCETCQHYERNSVRRSAGVIAPTTVCTIRSGEWKPDESCSSHTPRVQEDGSGNETNPEAKTR